MTDFFADLEQQLIGATAERAHRVRRARARRGATLATVLLAIVAGGAGLATALSGSSTDGGHGAPAGPTPTAPPHTIAIAPPTSPGTYTVAVLNATYVPGLARGVANVLQNKNYKIGTVTNAAEETRVATTVEYAPGHRAQATQVAAAIAARATTLRPIDHATRTIAGRQAKVVVLVGSDQNTARRP
jgi:LytR cell envelope-related transcriptional attenuator